MFVVRLKRPNEDFDLKAFATKRAAMARFQAAQGMMIDGEVDSCALFEAQATEAQRAVELVNQGNATLIASNLEDPPPQRQDAASRRQTR